VVGSTNAPRRAASRFDASLATNTHVASATTHYFPTFPGTTSTPAPSSLTMNSHMSAKFSEG
jgi:hypothetical protein